MAPRVLDAGKGYPAEVVAVMQNLVHLVGHFDVEHSTFQLESAGHIEHERGGHQCTLAEASSLLCSW